MTNKINIQFQSEKPNIHILSNFIERAHIDDGFDFANEKTMLQRFLEVDSIYLEPNANKLIVDETVTQAEAHEVNKSCRNYYIELCIEIRKRFNFAVVTINAIQLLKPNSLGYALNKKMFEPMHLCGADGWNTPDAEGGSVRYQWRR